MATLDELKQGIVSHIKKKALQETLESRGALSKLRAQVRAEIFHTLEDSVKSYILNEGRTQTRTNYRKSANK